MPRPKSYHHGNLRNALIDAGLNLLRSSGVESLTTRGCAQAVGVASSAVFRHFPDRRALATAVAVEGFRMLGTRIAQAQSAARSDARFRAIGESYLTFAIDEPHLFRLMFRAEVIDISDAGLREASEPLLGDTASASGAEGQLGRDRAILAWAIVHGLATLALDSQLDDHMPADPAARRQTLMRIIGLTSPLFEQGPTRLPE